MPQASIANKATSGIGIYCKYHLASSVQTTKPLSCRPKGRKNNKTLVIEAFKQSIGLVEVKRGRERSKDGKNNKTLEIEAAI